MPHYAHQKNQNHIMHCQLFHLPHSPLLQWESYPNPYLFFLSWHVHITHVLLENVQFAKVVRDAWWNDRKLKSETLASNQFHIKENIWDNVQEENALWPSCTWFKRKNLFHALVWVRKCQLNYKLKTYHSCKL